MNCIIRFTNRTNRIVVLIKHADKELGKIPEAPHWRQTREASEGMTPPPHDPMHVGPLKIKTRYY